MSSYPLLETIDDPAQLRRLDRRQLAQLAAELRAFIVDSVAATGGHLSSNLGTVELTVALHYGSTRRPTSSSGTSATRPTGTRSSPGGARAWGGCARRAASRASRAARKATTTRSARRTRRPRSRPRSAWRWPRKRLGSPERVVAVIGDGAMSGRHGVRGAEQRQAERRRRDRDPERQRHVDLGERRRAQQLPGQAHVGALLRRHHGPPRRCSRSHPDDGARQALRGARQGHARAVARSSRSSASTTSARSTATTSTC